MAECVRPNVSDDDPDILLETTDVSQNQSSTSTESKEANRVGKVVAVANNPAKLKANKLFPIVRKVRSFTVSNSHADKARIPGRSVDTCSDSPGQKECRPTSLFGLSHDSSRHRLNEAKFSFKRCLSNSKASSSVKSPASAHPAKTSEASLLPRFFRSSFSRLISSSSGPQSRRSSSRKSSQLSLTSGQSTTTAYTSSLTAGSYSGNLSTTVGGQRTSSVPDVGGEDAHDAPRLNSLNATGRSATSATATTTKCKPLVRTYSELKALYYATQKDVDAEDVNERQPRTVDEILATVPIVPFSYPSEAYKMALRAASRLHDFEFEDEGDVKKLVNTLDDSFDDLDDDDDDWPREPPESIETIIKQAHEEWLAESALEDHAELDWSPRFTLPTTDDKVVKITGPVGLVTAATLAAGPTIHENHEEELDMFLEESGDQSVM